MAAGFGYPDVGYCRRTRAQSGLRRGLNFVGMADTGANAIMQWHDIHDPGYKLLDGLAAQYSLDPLHVEDCRQSPQRTNLETSESYLFISLKYST